ncbi:MAG: hypothetical protein RL509_631, partial [Pseudomonadota bacterium]
MPPAVKLGLCVGLALLMMLGDVRWGITQPLRTVVSVLIYPLQVVALTPIEWIRRGAVFFQSRDSVQREAVLAREKVLTQSAKAQQV